MEVGKAKGDAFYQADFAIDTFNKTTGYSMDEKTDDFGFPVLQCIAETIQCFDFQLGCILQPLFKGLCSGFRIGICFIPIVKPLS